LDDQAAGDGWIGVNVRSEKSKARVWNAGIAKKSLYFPTVRSILLFIFFQVWDFTLPHIIIIMLSASETETTVPGPLPGDTVMSVQRAIETVEKPFQGLKPPLEELNAARQTAGPYS
jgi:hypothetical protein